MSRYSEYVEKHVPRPPIVPTYVKNLMILLMAILLLETKRDVTGIPKSEK